MEAAHIANAAHECVRAHRVGDKRILGLHKHTGAFFFWRVAFFVCVAAQDQTNVNQKHGNFLPAPPKLFSVSHGSFLSLCVCGETKKDSFIPRTSSSVSGAAFAMAAKATPRSVTR